jgi:murein DD-endopeptidase MepM/ murein hydrolase activator NlpD
MLSIQDAHSQPAAKDLHDASQQVESLMMKQLLESSGAFKGSGEAGSQIRTSLFVEVMADAVAKSGGMGLAAQLESSLSPKGEQAPATPLSQPSAPTTSTAPIASTAALANDPNAKVQPLNLAGLRVTSDYGERIHPITGKEQFHTGIDLGAAEGSEILAAADGVVKSASARGGYGNAVEIDHGKGVTTLYGHAQKLLVKEGDHVTKGQPIAIVGHTGVATGPHLHFEVRMQNRPTNPTRALKAYSQRDEGYSGEGSNPLPRDVK